jgi:hypothetical protein
MGVGFLRGKFFGGMGSGNERGSWVSIYLLVFIYLFLMTPGD